MSWMVYDDSSKAINYSSSHYNMINVFEPAIYHTNIGLDI